jgi:predicted ester cyclase
MTSNSMVQTSTDRRGFVRATVVGASALALGSLSTTGHAMAGGPLDEATGKAARAALARAFYTPFNTGQVALYDTVLAPDWIDRPLGPGQSAGRDGLKPVVRAYRAALSGLTVTIEDVVTDGDKVAIRTTLRGTHEGTLLGVAPTGRRVVFRAADIHRIAGNVIAETWHLEDLFGLMQQLKMPR